MTLPAHDTVKPHARRHSWKAELRAILALALPNCIQGAAQQAMLVTDQVFLGHLGTSSLAAASLGNTYTNIMWCVGMRAVEAPGC
jgi:MATE family multidrug resistance protein